MQIIRTDDNRLVLSITEDEWIKIGNANGLQKDNPYRNLVQKGIRMWSKWEPQGVISSPGQFLSYYKYKTGKFLEDSGMPSSITFPSLHDIFAVLAGRKPSAICHSSFISPELLEEIIKEAKNRGMIAKPIFGDNFAVGAPQIVSQLENYFSDLHGTSTGDERRNELHRKIGKLLGYTDAAIEHFLANKTYRDSDFKEIKVDEKFVKDFESGISED